MAVARRRAAIQARLELVRNQRKNDGLSKVSVNSSSNASPAPFVGNFPADSDFLGTAHFVLHPVGCAGREEIRCVGTESFNIFSITMQISRPR